MASLQEPEVQFAQRLASNAKAVRNNAIKKLTKYISVRSLKGAFTAEELVKLWKGLFYCLWMQDKPLLQEELSRQISSLIHSFQSTEGQFLYMESFLQTIKREWTGIDRLRMDKFFQLVRFMFRQTFDMLKRTNWESSVVSRFLELLTLQVLHSGSDAPSGLQFHILDLYMVELAGVASTELTAEQNLTLIEPFCKTAAKTKDRVLFSAICSSIFQTIVDQAPFAIQDLMKELQESKASEGDSGQASEEEDEETEKEVEGTSAGLMVSSKAAKQLNGDKNAGDSENDDDDSDDDEELRHLEDMDVEELSDDEGRVLQFDYTCLASRLLELASHTKTPSHNRRQLYKIVKVLRGLSEGIFPRNGYPEEVSTDEDDDMFLSRKWIKRKRRNMEEEETGASTSKKAKGEKKNSDTGQKKAVKDSSEAKEPGTEEEEEKKKKKKKRKRRKKKKQQLEGGMAEEVVVAFDKETEASSQVADGHSKAPPPPEASALVPESNTGKKKKRKQKKELGEVVKSEAAADKQLPQAAEVPPQQVTQEPALKEQAPPSTVGKKKKKRSKKKLNSAEDGAAISRPPDEDTPTQPLEAEKHEDATTAATPPTKKKNKTKNKKNPVEEEMATPESLEEDMATTAPPVTKKKTKQSSSLELEGSTAEAPKTKKKKRKIPVEFEYEADELAEAAAAAAAASVNGNVGGARRSSRKFGTSSTPDFVTFQSGATAPLPLFCRSPAGGSTPLTSRKSSQVLSSDSKKVTFGLTRTAEFRKSDRSLLLSPDGFSRVPFDPLQKPKCGVLKSPAMRRKIHASPALKR